MVLIMKKDKFKSDKTHQRSAKSSNRDKSINIEKQTKNGDALRPHKTVSNLKNSGNTSKLRSVLRHSLTINIISAIIGGVLVLVISNVIQDKKTKEYIGSSVEKANELLDKGMPGEALSIYQNLLPLFSTINDQFM